MNAKALILFGFMLAAPYAAQAGSDPNGFLLKGDVIKVQADKSVLATGHAAVITKAGMRFTAEELTYDQTNGTLKLSGDVIIHAADGNAIRAKELTIDVKEQRVFMLSGGKIRFVNESSPMIPETALIDFTREFPKTELELRRTEPRP